MQNGGGDARPLLSSVGGLREPELNGGAGTVTNHRVAGKVDKPDVAGWGLGLMGGMGW